MQQLGRAEIEKLHPALGGDQHVRRLQVTMNDQVAVNE